MDLTDKAYNKNIYITQLWPSSSSRKAEFALDSLGIICQLLVISLSHALSQNRIKLEACGLDLSYMINISDESYNGVHVSVSWQWMKELTNIFKLL